MTEDGLVEVKTKVKAKWTDRLEEGKRKLTASVNDDLGKADAIVTQLDQETDKLHSPSFLDRLVDVGAFLAGVVWGFLKGIGKLLEGIGMACLLVGLLLLWRRTSTPPPAFWVAGAVLGAGAATKIWGVVPMFVVAAWVWRTGDGWRRESVIERDKEAAEQRRRSGTYRSPA